MSKGWLMTEPNLEDSNLISCQVTILLNLKICPFLSCLSCKHWKDMKESPWIHLHIVYNLESSVLKYDPVLLKMIF